MALHHTKEEALLLWLNALQLDEPVQRLLQLKDGILLLKFVSKLKGEEPSQAPVHLPQAERWSIISDFLHSVCHVEECLVLMLAKGRLLELELTKVVLLLWEHGFVNNNLVPNVGYETQMATMMRYVQRGASGVSLRDGLDKLLTTSSLTCSSSISSASSLGDDGSPFFPRKSPLVNFIELDTVASSSFNSSPLQQLTSTPVQVKRLRKELVCEGEVRDELERQLNEHMALLSDKEGQINQLQYRLQRVQRDQEEMEQDHKALLTELQQKNEGLGARVHEVLKQCRDLKSDNGQKERRLDELLEENGALAAQLRNGFAQLTKAEEEVAKLSEEHRSLESEWRNKTELLQRELSQALTDRESLRDKVQILEGKLSVLEDELSKLSQQTQEKGEVLGPIIEHEKLKQELAELTLKLSQLEEIISVLEKEKLSVETLLAEERISFQKEILRLEGRISDLQQSLNNIQAEKDTQEQASRTKQETFISQITALETELAHLQQLEVQLTAEITTSAELRRQRGMLAEKVASSEDTVQSLQSKCQNMEAENVTQQEVLNAVRADLQNAQISLVEYEKKLAGQQKVVEENACLRARISALDNTIANLQTEMDGERKRGDELLTANEQQKGFMEENFQKQEQKAHEMVAELETLSQELRKLKNQKLYAESCIERLTQERVDLKASLAEERDHNHMQLVLVNKAKEEKETELQLIITENESKISELRGKIEGTVESLKQSQSELSVLKLKLISKDGELGKQQQERAHLQNKADTLQRQLMEVEGLSQQLRQDVLSKDKAVQHLMVEIEQKEGDIRSLMVSLQSLEVKSCEMRELHQKEVEKLRLVITELKLQLAKNKEIMSENVKSLEDLSQQLKDLKEELSIERQKVAALELRHSKNEHLSSLNQSLQMECENLHTENKGQREVIDNLKADLQNTRNGYQLEVGTLKKGQDHLSSVNQSLQTECQNLEKENKKQQAALNVLNVDLQNVKDRYQQELSTLKKEKDHLISTHKGLEVEYKNLQSENKIKLEELNVLKADLQNTRNERQKELDLLKHEKQHLSSVTESLKTECEMLQAEKSKHQEELHTFKADLQESKHKYEKDLEMLRNEKDHLYSLNQTLQTEFQMLKVENKEQHKTLNDLKQDLQNARDGYHQELEALNEERERLCSVILSLQNECRNLQAEKTSQQQEMEHQSLANKHLQNECKTLQAKNKEKEQQIEELQEQLKMKTQSVEHYKVQVENARTHYNGKKQLLLEEKEARQNLQASLEYSEKEANALKAELNLVFIELEKYRESEKSLIMQIKSLEMQLKSTDHRLSCYSAPGESSTPLVRSSERLAAKRRAQDDDSLETLYFTPMMPRAKKRDGAANEPKLESSITSLGELTLNSSKKPSSSVRRRRTTQVINITMTKKAPACDGGAADADDSLFSLHSAQSQPNIASHKAQPVSVELFEDSSKLLSLPGYRRSNAHVGMLPRTTSAFCIGAENEPDHTSDDWMRLAELQSRNKSCLPHLKSSYPLESRPSLGFTHLPVTDEDVRTGDPTETIRRASMIPSTIKNAVTAHRPSLAPPTAAAHGRVATQCAPQVTKARGVRSTRSPLALKRPLGQVQDSDTPEVKKLVSCFPRTPKGRNLHSTNSQVAPSLADRRQSMAFVIDNTPKKAGRGDSRLQRGINKLRKSPGTTSNKSPKITSSAKKKMKFRIKI